MWDSWSPPQMNRRGTLITWKPRKLTWNWNLIPKSSTFRRTFLMMHPKLKKFVSEDSSNTLRNSLVREKSSVLCWGGNLSKRLRSSRTSLSKCTRMTKEASSFMKGFRLLKRKTLLCMLKCPSTSQRFIIRSSRLKAINNKEMIWSDRFSRVKMLTRMPLKNSLMTFKKKESNSKKLLAIKLKGSHN